MCLIEWGQRLREANWPGRGGLWMLCETKRASQDLVRSAPGLSQMTLTLTLFASDLAKNVCQISV